MPGIGRFASRDPAGFVDGVNLYAYVGNNPVNFVDPTGLYAAFSSQISGGTSGSSASKGATVALDAFYAGGGANQATGQQNLSTMTDGGQGDSSNGPVKLAMGPLLPLLGIGLIANEVATSDVPIIGGGAAKAGTKAVDIVAETVGALRAAGKKDAHHIIQDAAVRDLPGYSTNAAPGIQLPGPSNAVGTPHNLATTVQRETGGGTYAAEREIGYRALRAAGVSEAEARAYIQQADEYFRSLGVGSNTPTRIPGNR